MSRPQTLCCIVHPLDLTDRRNVQSNSVQSSPPESFLTLLFRYWRPLIRFLPRDFHFFISRCFPQLFLRAELISRFLIPGCAQPAFRFNPSESHCLSAFPVHVDFLQQLPYALLYRAPGRGANGLRCRPCAPRSGREHIFF